VTDKDRCRSCGGQQLTTFLSLGDMPLTDAYLSPEAADQEEPRYPLDVAFCSDCSLVQILYTVPPEEMFSEYSYYSSLSDTLMKHSRDHALALIDELGLGSHSLVMEIASNDGYLLKNFVERGVPVLGIDPARGPAEEAEKIGVPTVCDFFGVELARRLRDDGKRPDVIIAKNVLAHVPDLNGVVEGISIVLADEGIAEIETPYVKDLIDHLEFDTIYHEHLCYYSVTALQQLFERHGLAMLDITHHPIHGGSLRLRFGRGAEPTSNVARYLEQEEKSGITSFDYYRDFSEKVASVRANVRATVEHAREAGERVAAYGAAAKGTILLNASGIDARLIDFVADKSPHKQGKLLPGTRIPISAPDRLLDDMPDRVLLLAWNFADEILREQKPYLEAGGRFVIPIPEVREVGAETPTP
jgi:hypothetical protein